MVWPDPDYVAKWGLGPHYTADALVVRPDGKFLLVRRKDGSWAMPGGFLEKRESAVKCARRELLEETGVDVRNILATYGVTRGVENPKRDPRAWVVTNAYLFEVPWSPHAVAADDAVEVGWFDLRTMPDDMYADHEVIVIELLTRGIVRDAGSVR